MSNTSVPEAKKRRYIWTNGTYYLTKVGHDPNGNWAYWIKDHNRKRAVKIQHMAMYNTACTKLTEELLKFGKPAEQINKTLQAIIETYREHTGIGKN